MSTVKTYGTVAIMIACFAVVYPRFMHPLILRLCGWQSEPIKNNHVGDDLYPPGFKGMNPGQKKPDGNKDDIRRHMRSGPHPGMRAAAEVHRQQAQQGSGRGMMGVVLPMYAVGIVLYLGYTLFKVFNRADPKKNNQWGNKRNYYNRGSGHSSDRDRMGFPVNFDGSESEIKSFLHDEDQRRNLEELLTRADDKNVSVDEMRVLQKRLEETEVQMTRILKAMHSVSENVDNIADNGQPNPSEGEGSKTQDISPEKGNEAKEDVACESKTNSKEEAQTSPPSEKQSDRDRAGATQDRDAEDEDDDSSDDICVEGEINDAFDVEEAEDEGEEEDEEDQATDEIILDKSNQEEAEDRTTRQRNVKSDKEK